MGGFITRRWKVHGQQIEESTYPNEHGYITELQIKAVLDFPVIGHVPVELQLRFDPPVIQLPPDQAATLKRALDATNPED